MQINHQLQKVLNINHPEINLNDVHWKTSDSSLGSILFYKIGPHKQDEKIFLERIVDAKYSWLVINRKIEPLPQNCQIVEEAKWPVIQKEILDILYPLPSLKLIGITGTNGKTTTTDLILQLGDEIGKKGISIGTLGVRTRGKTIEDFGLTSPSFIDLRKYLNRYGMDKDFCVMEVSSHALVQKRLYGLEFDGAGWLSFSQDHLDYHQNLENYFKSKCLIFDYLKSQVSIYLPSEQRELFQKIGAHYKNIIQAPSLKQDLPLFFKPKFNKNNLEVAVALIEDVFKEKIEIDFNNLIPPDGRFFIKKINDSYVVVDFAHTPDALENICRSLRETFSNYKLKVLFGCGGDRDRSKRPLMGQVVDKFADEIYVTSDNPRSENPEQIIQDIIKGIQHHPFTMVIERPLAVKQAFTELKSKEILLLAGKGHENYILINGVKYPYSDIQELEDFINRK